MSRTLALTAVLAALSMATAHAADKAHGNFDHPAIAVARMAQHPGVDANHFLVQPPASTTWTVQPEAKLLAVAPLVAVK